jgi:hypothetical protein
MQVRVGILGVFFGRGNNFQIIVGFIDLYSEAEGLWSNPLIRFNPIHGRAVGLFIRYRDAQYERKGYRCDFNNCFPRSWTFY